MAARGSGAIAMEVSGMAGTAAGDRVGRLLYHTCRGIAWFGGVVLVALAVLSVASIAGRSASGAGFGPGPVPGDFELVELGTALAVFCFLPWCHLSRAHAVVDLLWRLYPPWLARGAEIAADLLMLVVWLLLTWRMGVAMLEYRAQGDTSFILRMPLWWGYASALVPAVLGCVAYAWRLAETLGVVAAPAGFVRSAGGH
ncbi:MAG: TRAP transporter small permease [Rhodocyclaceae bacterium]